MFSVFRNESFGVWFRALGAWALQAAYWRAITRQGLDLGLQRGAFALQEACFLRGLRFKRRAEARLKF